AQEQVALLQIGTNLRAEQISLHFVGQQNVDDIGGFGCVGERDGLEVVRNREVVVRTARPLPDDDLTPTVAQVLSLGVSLAAITQDGDCLVLKQGKVGIV